MNGNRARIKLLVLSILPLLGSGAPLSACCFEEPTTKSTAIVLNIAPGSTSALFRVTTTGGRLALEFSEPVRVWANSGAALEPCGLSDFPNWSTGGWSSVVPSGGSAPFPTAVGGSQTGAPFPPSIMGGAGDGSPPIEEMAGASSWDSMGGLGGLGGQTSTGGVTVAVGIGGTYSVPTGSDYRTCFSHNVAAGSLLYSVSRMQGATQTNVQVTGTLSTSSRSCASADPGIVGIMMESQP